LHAHNGHSIRVYLTYERELADLDSKARSALLRLAVYRRDWVAGTPDHELRQYWGIGPTLVNKIRLRIPYTGHAENREPAKPEPCPHCKGSGLRPGPEAVQNAEGRGADGRSGTDERLSARELLVRLVRATEQLNTLLTSLQPEHSRKVPAPVPRLLLSYEEAAASLGLRVGTIWDAISACELPFLRFGKGIFRVRPESLQEWLASQELRMRPQEDLPQPPPVPAEKLCTKCGRHEIHPHSYKRRLCFGCEKGWRQERRQREKQQRIKRLEGHAPHAPRRPEPD
jgi:excisionase family DNA binding protein